MTKIFLKKILLTLSLFMLIIKVIMFVKRLLFLFSIHKYIEKKILSYPRFGL